MRSDCRAERYEFGWPCLIDDHCYSIHVTLFRWKNFIQAVVFGLLDFQRRVSGVVYVSSQYRSPMYSNCSTKHGHNWAATREG